MSIAVMNWVWTSSPTSGNERLVLLALADACSRDDGTGCWPSITTIARKAAVSDRTVRRVIARLEAGGHLVVHRGGGRAGATNSYTVVTDIHNPGQSVRGDSLSGVTPVSGEGGHRCPGRGDTAVSPEPPRTTSEPPPPAPAREASGSPVDNGGAGGGNAHPHPRDARDGATPAAAPPGHGDAEAEFFATLGDDWPLSRDQRRRLAPTVAAALAAGWHPGDLATHVGANTAGVRNPYAVLSSRLSDLPNPPSTPPPRPPWCGRCGEITRHVEDDRGRLARCPTCHPLTVGGEVP